MGKTATVNPRRRRRGTRRRRRRNPQAYGAAANPRRRQRRRRPTTRRRRRNPMSPYQSRGYYMRPNPDGMFDFQEAFEILPPGVLGISAGRWATQMAGPFEMTPEGAQVPGWAHAFAIWLAAAFGAPIIGNLLGDARKTDIARIACLSWGGDMFVWKRFLRGNQWAQRNLYLGGFQETSRLASGMGQASFIDAAGNRYIRGPQGWQLAGFQETSPLAGTGQADAIEVPAGSRAGDVIQWGGRSYRLTASNRPNEFGLEALAGANPRRRYASNESGFGYAAA